MKIKLLGSKDVKGFDIKKFGEQKDKEFRKDKDEEAEAEEAVIEKSQGETQ